MPTLPYATTSWFVPTVRPSLTAFIVLFVSVWISVVPTTEPVTPWTPEEPAMCVSIKAWVLVPILISFVWSRLPVVAKSEIFTLSTVPVVVIFP